MTSLDNDGISVQVDLRAFWGEARDQGARNSCLACAASDAHAHSHGSCQPFSAEFLFFHAGQSMPGADVSAGLTFESVEQALSAEGQPSEAEWPYELVQPNPWSPPLVTHRWHGRMPKASASIDKIVKTVEAKNPVVLGIRLTQDFLALKAPFVISAVGQGTGGHAVLIVGCGENIHTDTLLLIRNSWGASWGDSGHAWLPTNYLKNNLIGYRAIGPL